MARPRTKTVATTGRGSPEAIQKRRAARRLNAFLTDGTTREGTDGRTEKRRRRLLVELDKGTRKDSRRPLKPIEILQHVHDLLQIGESLGAIRKVTHTKRNPAVKLEGAAELLRDVQAAYAFRIECYRFLGLPHEVLVQAKVVEAGAPRRGRPPRAA